MIYSPDLLILIMQKMPAGLTHAERCEYLTRMGAEQIIPHLKLVPKYWGNPEKTYTRPPI
jgi:hypothetical protein